MEHDALVEVLLTCLRPDGAETRTARLAQLAPGEWEALLHLAKRHGVTPLVYRRLQPLAAAASIPPGILQAGRREYLATAARNTQRFADLAAMLRQFRRENLPVIVLKGAHLAEVVYGSLALRPMNDIDLLIHRADLARADSLLLARGYRPDAHNGPWMEATHFHQVYLHPQSGLALEVHWHILPPEEATFVDIDHWWRNATPARIAGEETLVLAPADLLAHLCLHLYLHRFDSLLRAFCDIAEVVRHFEGALDWKELNTNLRGGTARKAGYLALRLTQELLDTPMPGDLLSALCAEDAAEWEAALREQILNPDTAALSLNTPGLVQLWGKQPISEKAAVLLRGLFPSAETMARLYPASAGSLRRYLYYPLYLSQVFRQFGLTAWRLSRGDKDLKRLASRLEALDRWLRSP